MGGHFVFFYFVFFLLYLELFFALGTRFIKSGFFVISTFVALAAHMSQATVIFWGIVFFFF